MARDTLEIRRSPGRRLVVVATAATIVTAWLGAVAMVNADDRPTTLRDAARYLQVGTAVSLPQLDTDAEYADAIAREFNAVTPENAMKWDTIEPQPGQYNFGPADRIVDFATANDQKVRGHTLVWHNQLPGWLTAQAPGMSADELRSILRGHIEAEAGHFRGELYAWDVVNEAINDDAAGSFRNTIWYQKLGVGYIADALRWAHAADPHAKLYLNDYNIEGINPKSTAYYNLAKELLADGVPLDGIGIQGHLGAQYGFPGDIAQNIKRFTDLGLDVAITELDVRMVLPVDDAKLAIQADYYSRVVNACLTQRRCIGVTVWGFTDKYSWVPGFFTGEGAACLYDESFQPKPAYDAVLTALSRRGKPTT